MKPLYQVKLPHYVTSHKARFPYLAAAAGYTRKVMLLDLRDGTVMRTFDIPLLDAVVRASIFTQLLMFHRHIDADRVLPPYSSTSRWTTKPCSLPTRSYTV